VLKKLARWDRTGRADAIADVIFDRYASLQVIPCRIFHGWAHHSLNSLRKAKSLGAVTVLERASCHILTQERLLQEEYRRHGLAHPPIAMMAVDRALEEYNEVDYVAVPSQFAFDSFLEHGFRPQKLILTPFGVDTRRFRPAERTGATFRALFVGQVAIRKGIQYLLRAWQELDLDDAELIVAGGIRPETRDVVERVLKENRGRSQIRLVGHVPDPVALFQSASAFVFPSVEEGSALVTYEAMACGLPVVVTPNAGSVVRDGIDGFVVPAGDVEALKDRLLQLHSDPKLRIEMGASARRRAEEFTWEAYGRRLVASYQRLS
jgi:glycosyltransferase involved in cell wall biosynthesis